MLITTSSLINVGHFLITVLLLHFINRSLLTPVKPSSEKAATVLYNLIPVDTDSDLGMLVIRSRQYLQWRRRLYGARCVCDIRENWFKLIEFVTTRMHREWRSDVF